ncbi:MAG: ATP-binding protein [Proteobacteria bacterium]|nr:ATP-binding protein [Pseudomonadota bacterium]
MDELLRILADWNRWWETGDVLPELVGKRRQYTLELLAEIDAPEVKALTGVRRSGKSTIFYQLIDWLLRNKNVVPHHILLVNFEDEALSHFTLDEIFNAYQTRFSAEGDVYLFLDEVQESQGWERWIRKKYDQRQKIHFFVTGSSAGLLSGEYATLLTGRNLTTTIYPLSFKEVLSFSEIEIKDISLISQETRNLINGVLLRYLADGGFPEIVFREEKMKRRLLNQYFQDIVYKDIVNRHGCHPTKIKDLAAYLMTNVSNLTSLRALRGTLGYGLNLIGEYLDYLEDAFLIFQLSFFDYSLKRQFVNPRKIYAIDNGLRNAVAFKFSHDKGRLMENLVFLELKRRNSDIFYWKDKRGKEVDFLVRKELEIESAIQACFDPEDEKTLQREVSSLEAAMREYDFKRSIIITMNDSRTLKVDMGTIALVPLYEWLLTG